MRAGHIVVLVMFCLALAARSVRADEQVEGRAVVQKALRALGGEEKLRKFTALDCKFKGRVIADADIEVEVKMDASVQGMDRWKIEAEATISGQTHHATLVLKGDKLWAKDGDTGKIEDAPAEVVKMLRSDFYALALALNPSLLLDKGCSLSPLGELKVDGKTAVGVRVSRKDLPDLSIYFDKEKGVPLTCELRVEEQDKQEKTHEFRFSETKETDGIKYFTKLLLKREGKTAMEGNLSDQKPKEKFEDSTFDKP